MRRREAALHAIPEGKSLEEVRAILKSESIPFEEETEIGPEVVLSKENMVISAAAGSHVLFTDVSPGRLKSEPDATQFPGRFDLQVVFLFDSNGKLKQHYVGHARLCP